MRRFIGSKFRPITLRPLLFGGILAAVAGHLQAMCQLEGDILVRVAGFLEHRCGGVAQTMKHKARTNRAFSLKFLQEFSQRSAKAMLRPRVPLGIGAQCNR